MKGVGTGTTTLFIGAFHLCFLPLRVSPRTDSSPSFSLFLTDLSSIVSHLSTLYSSSFSLAKPFPSSGILPLRQPNPPTRPSLSLSHHPSRLLARYPRSRVLGMGKHPSWTTCCTLRRTLPLLSSHSKLLADSSFTPLRRVAFEPLSIKRSFPSFLLISLFSRGQTLTFFLVICLCSEDRKSVV